MGINIAPVAMIDFDSGRYAGDQEFCFDPEAFKRRYHEWQSNTWRPENFYEAMDWVRDSDKVPGVQAKERLFKLLHALMLNHDIWIDHS